ncbi:hypothetical protein [Phenylobacterium sp.]|uniref:hypothetical protein n=1 Tax=Phenylobacterium sp. TaxID=1871053 RepID=UPI0025F9CCD1|nr:hypothetical protein [Phenylobacterium sp.]
MGSKTARAHLLKAVARRCGVKGRTPLIGLAILTVNAYPEMGAPDAGCDYCATRISILPLLTPENSPMSLGSALETVEDSLLVLDPAVLEPACHVDHEGGLQVREVAGRIVLL